MLKLMSFALRFTNDSRNLRKIVFRLKDRYAQNKDDIYGLSARFFHLLRCQEDNYKEGIKVFRQDNSEYCAQKSVANISFEKIKDLRKFELSPGEVKESIREEIGLLKTNRKEYKRLRAEVETFEEDGKLPDLDRSYDSSDIALDIMLARYECKMGRHRLDVIEKLV